MLTYNPNTAILLILFNRVNTARKVFERIREVRPKRLYLAADGPRHKLECKACEEARLVVSAVDWDCEVYPLYQEQNLGCDTHCYRAISWFFEREPEGIVLEDDCLPSTSFFGFCSTLLAYYRKDERIGHIAGSNYQFGDKRGDGSYYFSNLTHVGGWAGWRRSWQCQRLNDERYDWFERLDYLSHLASHAPFHAYWNKYFRLVNWNSHIGWDFRYAYANLSNNRLSVIPNYNLISNIGCYDRATHPIADYPFADLPNEEIGEIIHPTFVCPDVEADLRSQMREYNSRGVFEERQDAVAYLKERLSEEITNTSERRSIPRVIHQIYEDSAGPSDTLLHISKSWREQNPDWEYRFWRKADIDVFLSMHYPELIPVYESFPYAVQRWDAIRYLILYTFGGLYVDLDYECTEPIDPLLRDVECTMGLEPAGHCILQRKPYIVGNAFMATIPGHPYFKELIDAVFHANTNEEYPVRAAQAIMDSTGPYMTTRVYMNSPYQERVILIPSALVAPLTRDEVMEMVAGKVSSDMEEKIERSYAIHYFLGSWYEQLKS